MRKYENVDIVAALGAVVELNTEHYKSDYKYDIEQFKKATQHPDGENNQLLWMSRQSGTWCFPERNVYVKGTEAFNTWNGYADILGPKDSFYQTVIVKDRIIAYAVDIKSIENGRVKGNLYELDYRDHIRQLNHDALPVHTVSAKYEDGTDIRLPFAEFNSKSERLYHQHGKILSYRADPEDTGALRDILKQAQDRREDEARPAVFKVRVQNPKPRKPSIRQQIAKYNEQLTMKDERLPAHNRSSSIVHRSSKGLEM